MARAAVSFSLAIAGGAALVSSPGCRCKGGDGAQTGADTTGAPTATASTSAAGSVFAQPTDPCALPPRLDRDLTVRGGCVVEVGRNLLVEAGTTLTLEAGVTLRFHAGVYLGVGLKGSRVVARGTQDRPIVLTSASKNPKAGDWVGVVLDDELGEGTLLEHVIVEYAGQPTHGGEGGVTAFGPFPAGRVSVRDCTFRDIEGAAVSDRHPEAAFAAFERNTFRDVAIDLRASPGVLASIGEGNAFGKGVELLGGTVTRSLRFPRLDVPVRVRGPLSVNGALLPAGAKTDAAAPLPPVLTIAPGTVLRFAAGTWLEVGTTGPGALMASRVTFRSAAEPGAAGDWAGLIFGEHAAASHLEGGVIEHAGAEEHGGDGALTVLGNRPLAKLGLAISGVSFRSNKQAHVSSNGAGCDVVIDPLNTNQFGPGVEPCR